MDFRFPIRMQSSSWFITLPESYLKRYLNAYLPLNNTPFRHPQPPAKSEGEIPKNGGNAGTPPIKNLAVFARSVDLVGEALLSPGQARPYGHRASKPVIGISLFKVRYKSQRIFKEFPQFLI